eukprot:4447953-Amphidinium_carterae.1
MQGIAASSAGSVQGEANKKHANKSLQEQKQRITIPPQGPELRSAMATNASSSRQPEVESG